MVHTDFGPPSAKYKEEPVDDSCFSFCQIWKEAVMEKSPAIDGERKSSMRVLYLRQLQFRIEILKNRCDQAVENDRTHLAHKL
ncbi:hypothetical protein N7448_000801 [Penicillium atrosanguineum]|uniref:uncharacterized protein n=1 Tax=Penicillium atrosanguineum TaxID=1132637 RepID=UPI00239139BD|nr:uncharacterized protein N7443_004196 [Penicillium atrosanguineum]KAJ5134177.1 hypothetical protein N7526_005542 [Penicillium atrosanguineum]KAJ5149223.1 hypothetical protein N7448_000801 [Penicillium atrosanguineum]KAJ5304536.1 hypothetical protein N7443_004196 [Penicillium atrosanguineum]